VAGSFDQKDLRPEPRSNHSRTDAGRSCS
jgi:hypothetical protein